MRRAWVLVVVAAAVAAGCGGEEPPPPLAQPIDRAGWRAEALAGASGAPPVAFSTREALVVLAVSSAGEVRSWRSADGGPFRPVPGGPPASPGLRLVGAVARQDVALAVGTTPGDHSIGVLLADGDRPWTQVLATGLQGPADLGELVATDDGFVLVGSRRTPGGPVPVVWRSSDGRAWTETALPYGSGGGATGVTTIGSDLLVVGPGAPAGLLWRSKDGGGTWALEATEVPGTGPGFRLHDVALARGVLVVSGSDPAGSGSVLARSVDGGASWEAVTTLDGIDRARIGADLWGFTVASARRALHSRNGDSWSELDLRGARGLEELRAVRFHPSGTAVLIGHALGTPDRSVTAWTWSAGTSVLPTTIPPRR